MDVADDTIPLLRVDVFCLPICALVTSVDMFEK